MTSKLLSVISVIIIIIYFGVSCSGNDIDSWVELPTKCETCKLLAVELESRFAETGNTNEVIRTGSNSLDDSTWKKTNYRRSELRLVESLEGICDRLLTYRLHKEFKDSRRFSKGRSDTMKTLHGLVEKGVKVELGIPFDLWDTPSVEITQMKQHCEQLVERYEEAIERWYFFDQKEQQRVPLMKYLCEDRVLKKTDQKCLHEGDEPADDRKAANVERKNDEL